MSDPTGLVSRRAALEAVRRVEEDGAYSNLAVPDAIAALPDSRDRSFASHLAYETLRWRGTSEWMLSQVVDRSLAEVEPSLLRILRLGAVQIARSHVPARAAVSTSAELAGETVPAPRRPGATGFVNGVLRALVRQEASLPWPDEDVDPVAAISLRTAHAAWIVRDLLGRYDGERTAEILAADNEPPGLTLRATGDRDELVRELAARGLDAAAGRHAPEAVRVPGADPRQLEAVQEGRAVPQDEASMVVAHATEVQPGDRVLDLCAGPGGKATHLASLGGRVTAVEVRPARAQLVREAARRLGLDIETVVGDGTDPPVEGTFDVVVVDAPCTGLGTGRRRPEVRWRRTPDDVTALAGTQMRLLEAARARLASGGRLTYSVCTWTEGETTAVADAFSQRQPELEMAGRRQLLPDVDDTDGMFVVVWRDTSPR